MGGTRTWRIGNADTIAVGHLDYCSASDNEVIQSRWDFGARVVSDLSAEAGLEESMNARGHKSGRVVLGRAGWAFEPDRWNWTEDCRAAWAPDMVPDCDDMRMVAVAVAGGGNGGGGAGDGAARAPLARVGAKEKRCRVC